MTLLHPRVLRRPLALLITAAAVVSGVVLLLPGAPATARAGLRQGLGYRIAGGEFVGFYVTAGGLRVWCLSPRRALPGSVALRTTARYPGHGAATTAAIAYALAAWGDPHTRDAAAVQSQVLNTLVGNRADVARRARSVPARLRATVAAHVAAARSRRGPYRVAVSLPAAVTPGRGGTGAVGVTSAAGRPVPGAAVTLAASHNLSVPRAIRTDARGRARLRYVVTDVGEVRVVARVTGLAPVAVRVSSPRPGEQRMVSAAPRTAAAATASFRATPGGFAHRYSCTTDCDGRPATVLHTCAPASRVSSRIVYRVGTRTLVVGFGPSRRTRCRDTTLTTRDGDRVSGRWQYRVGSRWSAPVPARGTFTVDCPAPPPVGVTLAAGCATASVTAGLAQPGAGGRWLPFVNTSRHRMLLLVSGDRSARVVASAGHEAVWSTAVRCGSHVRLTFRGGVERSGGGWNFGQPVTVRLP